MQDHVVADPLEDHAHAEGEGPDGNGSVESKLQAGDPVDGPPRLVREDPGASPQRLAKLAGQAKEDWQRAKEEARGKEYGHDHGRPRSPEERLRANVPYSEYFGPAKASLMSRIQVGPRRKTAGARPEADRQVQEGSAGRRILSRGCVM